MPVVFLNELEVVMKEFCIRLAEKNIKIVPRYDYIFDYCKEYICMPEDKRYDFCVEISQKDIDVERYKSEKEDLYEGRTVRVYSDEYLETLAVYRKIVEKLLEDEIILVHGSLIAVDGKGYLFIAKSGTGKSTHTRLWREYFGNRAVMVNDDKPLLKIKENKVFAYGTPWDGEYRISNNICVPLVAVCALSRGKDNVIHPVDTKRGINKLLESTYRVKDVSGMMRTLDILEVIVQQVGLYEMTCNMESIAACVAYDGMKL